jgi:hydrogenase maturation protein HypF
VIDNAEARARLAGLADAFLLHDRDIVVRTDDSLLRPGRDGAPQFIRRARGYTPSAIRLPHAGPAVLALGGHLKTTICVTRGDEAFLSQHIGGLDNPAACAMHAEVTRHLLDLLEVEPVAVAHDLHPDFHSTRQALAWAKTHAIPAVAVQHHHAHLAAVAAEHGATGPLLGLALDGNGLGTDGGFWGGELLALDGARFTRLGHLAPLPLPGGENAARQPWRMAAALLFARGRTDDIVRRYGARGEMLVQMLAGGVNCPASTSLGRVFDAAAGLLGVCAAQHYEGQAAMQLESLATPHARLPPYPDAWTLTDTGLDLGPLLEQLADADAVAPAAARFHATLAEALATWLGEAARQHGIGRVALAGGCLLNRILARDLSARLAARGLDVLEARQAPPNDGGLALGQAWIALHTLMEGNPPCV